MPEGCRLALLAVLLIGLAACGADRPVRAPRMWFSPNGEPLSGGPLGHPSCNEALSHWLGRADTNHDGAIDLAEYRADARHQFAVMDLDHDGIVTPAELDVYRAPYGTVAEARRPTEAQERRPGELSRLRPGSDQPDPVMAADTKLRYRVSLADFMAYADLHFAELDANHDGRISLAELQRSCSTDANGN